MKTEFISRMGTDLTVVDAARVSFDKKSDWDVIDWKPHPNHELRALVPVEKLKEKDERLIRYLANHGHFTPFTHCMITLRETVPIFVARQRFKHVIGFTYNEVSRRYVSDEPEFFRPDEWRSASADKKQGSSDLPLFIEDVSDPQGYLNQDYEEFLRYALNIYKGFIRDGVAPEQARMVLPQSMYTSYYVTGSLQAFARAYMLRSDEHAQKEIQDLAKQWDTIIRPRYPVSWSALLGELL